MQTTYKISEKDYISANRLAGKLSMRSLAITFFILIMFVGCIFVTNLIPMTAESIWPVTFGIIFFIISIICIQSILNPLISKFHYRKYPLIRDGQFDVKIDEESVQFEIAGCKTELIWKHILKWRENEHFILLFISPRQYFIVPKTLSEQGFDINLLKEKLSSHVGKSK